MITDVITRLFQFHEGPIKTPDETVSSVIKSCFNSMKVRLKRVLRGPPLIRCLFQFHEGPIKTYTSNGSGATAHEVSIP